MKKLLTSGAHTYAKKIKDPRSLDMYLDYRKEVKADITCVLDTVPSVDTKHYPTNRHQEVSRRNLSVYREMVRLGVKEPMVVLRPWDPPEVIHAYLDLRVVHVALDPFPYRAGSAESHRWIETMWTHFGLAEMCVMHAYRISELDLIKRYPWNSASCSTWAINASYGVISVPKPDGTFFDVRVDEGKYSEKRQSVNSLGPHERRYVERHVEKMGMTMEDVKLKSAREQLAVRTYKSLLGPHVNHLYFVVQRNEMVLLSENANIEYDFAYRAGKEHKA
jgi:hypothetical protein